MTRKVFNLLLLLWVVVVVVLWFASTGYSYLAGEGDYTFPASGSAATIKTYSGNEDSVLLQIDGSESPHVDYTATSSKCAICHRTHSASGISLRSSWPEESLCVACHNGVGATTDIAAQFDGKSYVHPVAAIQGLHRSNEGSYNWLPTTERHVECSDCHNPHASWAGNATPGTGDLAGVISGTWGVTVTNPSTVWTDLVEADYSKVSPITEEYQLCMKCHSSYAYDVMPPLSHIDGISETDQAKEFNVNNASYHWVENDQLAVSGDTPRTNTVDRDMTFTPSPAMSKDTPMNCSDCHASDVDTEPRGSHGSDIVYLLRGTWSDTTDGNDYGLCLLCHEESVYGPPPAGYDSGSDTPGMTSFAGEAPNLHRFHMDMGPTEVAGCQNCHSAVPHGGWNRAMLVETTDPLPYSSGSRLQISSWAAPGQWAEDNCSGSVCH